MADVSLVILPEPLTPTREIPTSFCGPRRSATSGDGEKFLELFAEDGDEVVVVVETAAEAGAGRRRIVPRSTSSSEFDPEPPFCRDSPAANCSTDVNFVSDPFVLILPKEFRLSDFSEEDPL